VLLEAEVEMDAELPNQSAFKLIVRKRFRI